MDDVDMVHPYSYWSSVGVSPRGPSSHLTSSSHTDLNSSHSEGQPSSDKDDMEDDLSDM